MSDTDSYRSDSGSPSPEEHLPDPKPSSDIPPLSSATTLPSSELPCQYQPSCPDQCPGFLASQGNPLYCICGHQGRLHRISDPTEADTPTPTLGSGKSSAISDNPRWLKKVKSIRSGQTLAKAEVNDGYQGKGKGRAVSTPVPRILQPTPSAPAQPSGSGSRQPFGKQSRRASRADSSKLDTPKAETPKYEYIKAIYFVEHAHADMKSFVNNQHQRVVQFSKVPSLNTLQKANLEGTGLARVSTDNDPLTLNPTSTPEELAQTLADWFPVLYTFVNPSGGPAPVDWCYELIKHYHELNSTTGALGLPPSWQLIDRAFTKARDKKTREIYLAITKELTNDVRMRLGLPPTKRSRDESEDEGNTASKNASKSKGTRGTLQSTSGSSSSKRATKKVKVVVTPSPSPSPEPVAAQPTSPTAIVSPLSPTGTEVQGMAELEAATSSFILDDNDSDVEIIGVVPSTVTRSKHAAASKAIAQDPVMAAYANHKFLNPFADDDDF
ncbi:hypothetical protein FRC07_003815 [Ceratobasidium sp. 392]|nr:hypothetical protein FRC07_003815 [Ceratobasidium sp. 392]